MNMRTRVGRTMIATLLSTCLALVTVNPALAQNRGNSGLSGGRGNPMAQLQRQINTLTQQVAALARLGQDVSTLKQQVAALQQQVPATSGALGVFDANEKKIGDVVGVQDNITWVSLTADGHTFVLQVLPGQLIGQFLWYTGASCSGTVYIAGFTLGNGPNVLSLAAVHEPGGVVYVADPYAAPRKVRVQSVQERNGTCSTFPSSFNQNVVPAAPVMTLDEVFQRPYSVQ